jgi:hypothetical protein
MIWFSVSQAKAKDSSGTFFNGCGFALRARQSKDFGWCPGMSLCDAVVIGNPITIPVGCGSHYRRDSIGESQPAFRTNLPTT